MEISFVFLFVIIKVQMVCLFTRVRQVVTLIQYFPHDGAIGMASRACILPMMELWGHISRVVVRVTRHVAKHHPTKLRAGITISKF